jgi:hypothetical protein
MTDVDNLRAREEGVSAASKPAATPLFAEGTEYWQELVSELKRRTEQINQAAAQHGLSDEHFVHWEAGAGARLMRAQRPSTGIDADLHFHSWGPTISGSITGYESEELPFFPQEFEVMIAKDLDGAVVAVFDEGRSFSPRELAAYLTQHFRRCFPDIPLPCEDVRSERALEAVSA